MAAGIVAAGMPPFATSAPRRPVRLVGGDLPLPTPLASVLPSPEWTIAFTGDDTRYARIQPKAGA